MEKMRNIMHFCHTFMQIVTHRQDAVAPRICTSKCLFLGQIDLLFERVHQGLRGK
jgi:hypothetical protein